MHIRQALEKESSREIIGGCFMYSFHLLPVACSHDLNFICVFRTDEVYTR